MNASKPSSANLSPQNPWPGLRAFTEEDREFFFGRERETAELLDLVQRSPVVVLYGQSGLGKTSLLQAGLFPGLKRFDFLPIRLRFDHSDGAPPLADQVKAAISSELDRGNITGPRPSAGETLWEYFHRNDVDFWGPRNRLLTPVMVLDQFEEVFTLGQRSAESVMRVSQFASELEALLEHRPPDAVRERLEAHPDEALQYNFRRQGVKFVVAMREDFLADLDPWRVRMPSLLPNRFRLERMTGAQALDVVQRGGRALIEPEVARDIVDFVSTSRRKQTSRAMEQRDVEPALLSVVCDELNLKRVEHGQSRITRDLLSGEREEIIRGFYERAFDGVDPRVRNWVEDQLLTASGYRDRAALEDALRQGLPESDFDQLVNRRILHREERSGVVWLELTHDLLSDPASESRSLREQRRQAEAAKKQAEEAQEQKKKYERDLRKSRLVTAVFGVLLIGTAVALYSAVKAKGQAVRAKEQADKATEQAVKAKEQAVNANLRAEQNEARAEQNEAEAKQREAESESNYKKAEGMTERLSFGISGGWVPAASVFQIIRDTEKSYVDLANQGTSSRDQQVHLVQRHARFLAKAADALYQIGHFEEGLTDARSALDLLNTISSSESSDRLVQVTLAESLYQEGYGLLATGQIKDSKNVFDNVSTLARSSQSRAGKLDDAKLPNDVKLAMERVYVLSQIGLGQAELQGLLYDKALIHFKDAIISIEANGGGSEEALSWKVSALMGLGSSQWDDSQAQYWFAKASEILPPNYMHPDDPQWLKMSAELACDQGFAAMRLGQNEEAKGFFKQSETDAENLYRRDSENLLWRLVRVESLRGLGMIHYQLGVWDLARTTLKLADVDAKELSEKHPSWTRAGFLHGVLVGALGDVQELYYIQSDSKGNMLPSSGDPKDLISAFKQFSESRKLLQTSEALAPGDLEFVREVALAFSREGSFCSLVADVAPVDNCNDNSAPKKTQESANEKYQDALDFYSQAFKELERVESVAKDSPVFVRDQADLYKQTGDVLHTLKRQPEEKSSYNNAVNAFLKLVKVASSSDNFGQLAQAQIALGDVDAEVNESTEAYAQYESAMKSVATALKLNTQPNNTVLIRRKAKIQSRFSDIWFSRGDLKRALDELENACDTLLTVLRDDYSNAALNENLGIYRSRLNAIKSALLNPKTASGPQKQTLTPQQSRTLLDRADALLDRTDPVLLLTHNKQDPWALPPLLPGGWRMLAGAERTAVLRQLSTVKGGPIPDQVRGIRRLPLDFYENAALYELEVQSGGGWNGIISYVQRFSDRWVLLDGYSDPIHDMNAASPPKLDTIESAIAYLRFFLSGIKSGSGSMFKLVEEPGDIDWRDTATSEERSDAAKKIKPLIVEPSPDGEWQAIGTIEYNANLDEADFRISRVGIVHISHLRVIAPDLPILVQTFEGGVRIQETMEELQRSRIAQAQQTLQTAPDDRDSLRDLPVILAGLARLEKTNGLALWKEAVEAEKNWIAYVQRESDDTPARRATLRGAYQTLSWYQLFARDFAGSRDSSEAGNKINEPDDLHIDTNLAHALLFLGKIPEADAIYLGNSGRKIDPASIQTWNEVILKDFDDLEKGGITSPEFARLRKLLHPQTK